jgi:hypothetical protein
MRGDNGGNKALPQTSNVSSDKRYGGDGGDSKVAMMAAAAKDGSSGQQQQLRMMTVMDNDSMKDQVADYNREGQEQGASDGGDSRVAMMAAGVGDGGGGQ